MFNSWVSYTDWWHKQKLVPKDNTFDLHIFKCRKMEICYNLNVHIWIERLITFSCNWIYSIRSLMNYSFFFEIKCYMTSYDTLSKVQIVRNIRCRKLWLLVSHIQQLNNILIIYHFIKVRFIYDQESKLKIYLSRYCLE